MAYAVIAYIASAYISQHAADPSRRSSPSCCHPFFLCTAAVLLLGLHTAHRYSHVYGHAHVHSLGTSVDQLTPIRHQIGQHHLGQHYLGQRDLDLHCLGLRYLGQHCLTPGQRRAARSAYRRRRAIARVPGLEPTLLRPTLFGPTLLRPTLLRPTLLRTNTV